MTLYLLCVCLIKKDISKSHPPPLKKKSLCFCRMCRSVYWCKYCSLTCVEYNPTKLHLKINEESGGRERKKYIPSRKESSSELKYYSASEFYFVNWTFCWLPEVSETRLECVNWSLVWLNIDVQTLGER